MLLLLATLAALGWANWGTSGAYDAFWERPLSLPAILSTGSPLTLSVRGWINDALMALFFLIVGLEIEREFVAGSLRDARAAALPIAAAVGGMIVPAVLYAAVAGHSIGAHGWGVPMATDIAFALGLLGLLAPGVPNGVRAFLAALAIVDDLGAILVIALVYAGSTNWLALGLAALCVLLMFALRRLRVHAIVGYAILSIPLWLGLHAGGVHPSLTGVLLAFALPTGVDDVKPSPSQRVERALHTWVAVFILPLFALANAGVVLNVVERTAPIAPAMIGVLIGLVLGKPLGIVAASWLAVQLRIAALPADLTWKRVLIVGAFGGIGFTMAIFVTGLAFPDAASAAHVKMAVLAASVVAASTGALFVRLFERRSR